MPASLPVELRERIVNAHEDQGLSEKKVAERSGVARSSVRRYVARSRLNKSLEPNVPRGAEPKLGFAEIDWIKEQPEKNPFQSRRQLC